MDADKDLPLATAVFPAPPQNMDGNITIPTATIATPVITTATIKDIVQEEISSALKKEKLKNIDQFSSFQVAMMKEVNATVGRDTASFLKNYAAHELPDVINSRVGVLFPRFAADSSLIRRHLETHLRSIDDLVSTRKKDVAFELDVVAKAAAAKMAHTDTFGYIYDSVMKTANKRVTEESLRVQEDVFARVEAELQATRTQRDGAMRQFSALNVQLEGHLAEQKKYKIVALSGFCMGMVSLTSVVLASLLGEKR